VGRTLLSVAFDLGVDLAVALAVGVKSVGRTLLSVAFDLAVDLAVALASRGTFYVEKGAPKEADRPLLCIKQSGNTYEWLRFGTP